MFFDEIMKNRTGIELLQSQFDNGPEIEQLIPLLFTTFDRVHLNLSGRRLLKNQETSYFYSLVV